MSFLKKFLKNEKGATAIEYGLIAALIAVVMIVGLRPVGNTLKTKFQGINTELNNAGKQ